MGGQGRLVIRFLDNAPPMPPATKQACRAELMELAKLRHPHIGQVLSVDAAPDGVPFVVRDHVEGQSLKAMLADGRWLPPAAAVRLVGQVARTLAAAHRARVIHRDLRPSQVFVRDAGGIVHLGRVLGFGLWRLRGQPGAPGAPVNRLSYLAPEQLDGQPVDGRADQFSLAAIAYRLLSGTDAFPGADAGAVLAALRDHAPAPLTALDGVSPAVEAVIRRGLARSPGGRFPSMLAFAAALEAASAGQPPDSNRP